MMYGYMTLADGTEIVHSQILDNNRVDVHFERPSEDGFDSVRFELPEYSYKVWEGNYTDEELEGFKNFLESNAHLIYRYAREGGIKLA
jgi:hypothetical protein